jgi:hypothetical protein
MSFLLKELILHPDDAVVIAKNDEILGHVQKVEVVIEKAAGWLGSAFDTLPT